MIRNYIKIAWRNLLRNKVFSAINIVGLSIGVAACLLITLFIIDETNYDKQIPNSDNIYRLTHFAVIEDIEGWGAHHSALMASTIHREFEEVENAGRLLDNELMYGAGSNEISLNELPSQYHEEHFAYADQAIVDIFDLEMVEGEASSSLIKPLTIIISESKAKKYFKNSTAVGQVMYLNGNKSEPYKITGVYKDFPKASNFNYKFLLTLKGVEFGEGEQTRWTQNNYFNFLQLKPATNIAAFEDKMTQVILNNYILPAFKNGGYDKFERLLRTSHLDLQPLADIHLRSKNIYDGQTHGDIRFVWIFGAIAFFILIIACINFINLSTAKSANRAKEVGLRKVIGSGRKKLILQFLVESMVITILAFGFGIVLAMLGLSFFNSISGKLLTLPWSTWYFIPSILLTALFIGMLAGIYPALYLSKFAPINVLKGALSKGAKSSGLRSSLVVFQFTISIILIVSTLIINNQMDFILNKEIGFEKDQVLQIHGVNMLGDRLTTFTNEIKQIQGVTQISNSDYLPIKGTKRNGNTFYNKEVMNADGVPSQAWIIDEGYLDTFGMHLNTGRNFDKNRATENESVIINQTLAEKFGMQNPLGKKILRGSRTYTIIGVVEDFNFESLQQEVGSIAMFYGNETTITSIKINTDNIPETLASIEHTWKAFVPNLDFRYTFMDESYANMYANVERMRKLIVSFAILSIFVACLGLFALSAFLVEQRKKELSIRKVLGASLHNLFKLLTTHFLILVVISIIIAIPISFFIMDNWLQDYAYKISISWEVFALSGILAILITMITISYHTIKAGLVNPIDSLKSE
ncbi:ABC transporter permease [Aquimarina sp. 2201CG14-23]|uniref:ABC transporter permease n=1 Tax=Aquimarina mycalae TaxID=3040073 RepID=UPI002478270E|nr:ABC transporter permease [Aquimarina sp. 2201CG14-23]MDH7448142.1 ABC transporter permease [Aquimarina sp. 2201CG14-23]